MRSQGHRERGNPLLLLVGLAVSIAAYVYLGHSAIAGFAALIFGLLILVNRGFGAGGVALALIAGLIVMTVTRTHVNLALDRGIIGAFVLVAVLMLGCWIVVFGTRSGGTER